MNFGNGASLPGNAASLPGNGASLPGNGASLPGNGASLPGNGAAILTSEANAWMVQPRETTATTCNGYPLASEWEFAASYLCGGNGRIHTSDITVNGAKLGASLCSQCGTSAPPRVYLPATLSNVDRSVTLDVVLRIDFKGASVYDCAKDDYAVMVYDVSISQDDCQTFPTADLVTAVPAPQQLFAGANALSPVGEGWGLLVPATRESAVFKAAHYSKMVLNFYPEAPNAWRYDYPTTNVACNALGSKCLSGASLLLAYGLALANLAPVEADGTVYGIGGTVTGVPTWVSILTSTGTLNRTYLEVGSASVANNYVLPGPLEKSATPYQYDAVIGTGEHLFASARAAYGPSRARIDLALDRLCGGVASCENSILEGAFITDYLAGMSQSPSGETIKIHELYSAVAGSSPFVVTAMPQPGATASCSTADQRRNKQPSDATTPGFCIGDPPPPILDGPVDAGVDGSADAGSTPDASGDAGTGSGSDAGSYTPDAGMGSGSGSASYTPDAGMGSGSGSASYTPDAGTGSGSASWPSPTPDAGTTYSGSGAY